MWAYKLKYYGLLEKEDILISIILPAPSYRGIERKIELNKGEKNARTEVGL